MKGTKLVGTPDIRGASDWQDCTPDSENVTLAKPTRGLSFGEDGDIVVIKSNGQTATIPEGSLAVGVIHPLRGITAIVAEGTEASGIIAWF